MDHGFTRPKEPWEITDGLVYLIREISGSSMASVLPNYMEKLSDLAFIDSFKHSAYLKENIFRALPVMISKMGKKVFRPHLDFFIDPIFRATRNQN